MHHIGQAQQHISQACVNDVEFGSKGLFGVAKRTALGHRSFGRSGVACLAQRTYLLRNIVYLSPRCITLAGDVAQTSIQTMRLIQLGQQLGLMTASHQIPDHLGVVAQKSYVDH